MLHVINSPTRSICVRSACACGSNCPLLGAEYLRQFVVDNATRSDYRLDWDDVRRTRDAIMRSLHFLNLVGVVLFFSARLN